MIDYERLDEMAAGLMKERKAHLGREVGFIYRHGRRTAVGAVELRGRVTDDAGHDDALRVAAMFHDVGKGIEPHARTGALITRDALNGLLPPALLEEVVFLIGEHKNRASENLWARLLQDADMLDHFGTIEVCLSFQYGMESGDGLDSSLNWYQEHFRPYAARVRKRLHTHAALFVFDEKVAFTEAFVKRLLVEAAGAYVAGPTNRSCGTFEKDG